MPYKRRMRRKPKPAYPYGIMRAKYPSEAPWETQSNPINWERQASWHEGEGSRGIYKRKVHKKYPTTATKVLVASQDVARREIPETLCKELTEAGFKSAKTRTEHRDIRCEIDRAGEQLCYLQRVLPHIISNQVKKQITEVTEHIKRKPRKPEPCPD